MIDKPKFKVGDVVCFKDDFGHFAAGVIGVVMGVLKHRMTVGPVNGDELKYKIRIDGIDEITHAPEWLLCLCETITDNVNHPEHYTTGKIECIDYIQDKLTADEFRGYIKGNVLKYLTREKHKNGDEDIKKAKWYLDRLVEEIG